MEIGAKLQLKPGQSVAVLGSARGAALEFGADHSLAETPEAADAVIVFVANGLELDELHNLVLTAARDGLLTWVAYPKARQLGTDLNRDTLAARLRDGGVEPVRQVAVDDVWSALRFRPA